MRKIGNLIASKNDQGPEVLLQPISSMQLAKKMHVNLWEVTSSLEYAYMHGWSCELVFGDSSKKYGRFKDRYSRRCYLRGK
jgi:hypothetical protein